MTSSPLCSNARRPFNFLISALLALMVSACGGGGGGSDDGFQDPTAANAEAARVAAIYRYLQGLGSIALANLTETHVGGTREGVVNCSSGGTVTYADTTTSPGADPRSSITFDGCVEAIGIVSGTLTARSFLISLNSSGVGTFNVSWQADLTVDSYGMTFESNTGLVTRSPGNVVRFESFGGADLAMTLAAPDGSSVLFSNVRFDLRYHPATGLVNFGGSDLQMRDLSDANLNARLLPSDLRAPATAATAVISIGVPSVGSFVYRRSFDPTATDLEATGTTNSSVLDLVVESLPPSFSFSGSAGQYVWAEILEDPDLSLPASPP
jgi:hypothetical protein